MGKREKMWTTVTGFGKAQPVLLDIVDAGNFLGLTPWQVRNLLWKGELAFVKVGRKFYFRRETLLKWAEGAEEKHRSA